METDTWLIEQAFNALVIILYVFGLFLIVGPIVWFLNYNLPEEDEDNATVETTEKLDSVRGSQP